MEIIFLLISLVITLAFIYGIGRTLNTHSQLLRAYKTSEFLGVVHFFLGIMLMMVLFMTLCAFNNTFWHLPYLTR
jgi:hypothetical protein